MSLASALESHGEWWRDAGLDVAIAEKPVNWLKEQRQSKVSVASVVEDERVAPAIEQRAPVQSENPAPVIAPRAAWPSGLAAFQDFLAEDSSCPGGQYGRRRALPTGPADARLIILTDLPAEADLETGTLLSGAEGDLLDAMLAAIGLTRNECYIMSIAVTRPASGEIPVSDHSALTDFTAHHMSLLSAGKALILGDLASRLCLDGPMLEMRGRLHKINYNGGDMAVTNCFHPRTLLARPAFKKQAWQDLQLLMRQMKP